MASKVESINDFFNRMYVNFGDGKVFVWNSVWQKEYDKPPQEIWDLQTAKNYLQWLKMNQPMKVEL